jgi:hypothetical protein
MNNFARNPILLVLAVSLANFFVSLVQATPLK